jgi:hypothetical protein
LWIKAGTRGIGEEREIKDSSRVSGLAKEKMVLGSELPLSLDWRNYLGKNYMTRAKDQGWCGSCWAFAQCGQLEARLNIAYNTPGRDRDLSEQFLVSCDLYDDGCCGGNWWDSGKFLKEVGVPDEECFPYQDTYTEACTKRTNHPCEERCRYWESRLIKVVDYGGFKSDSVFGEEEKKLVKYELLNGPVYGAFRVKEDVFYYKGGTYIPIMGEDMGHAVVVIGWSEDGSWIVKNSWGEGWGDNGFGRYRVPFYTYGWLRLGENLYVDTLKFETNDGVWDKGEELTILVKIGARGGDFAGVKGKITTEDEKVEIIVSEHNFGEIKEDEVKSNEGSPFRIEEKRGKSSSNRGVQVKFDSR